MGLRIALRLVETVPAELGLTEPDDPDTAASSSSGPSSAVETRADRLGSEAVAATRGVAASHDVCKLGERLVRAIERPGGPVALAREAEFAAEFADE